MKKVAVAIDGPSGAGKSTISKIIAQELGFIYVDTGAIYRTVGLYMKRIGADLSDEARVEACLKDIDIQINHTAQGQQMLLNGEDVTAQIRIHEISEWASAVSAIPAVRAFLLDMQRGFAKKYSVIMDGRDIGTVVLPDAEIKIFLTASSEDRAKRRHIELGQKGQNVEFETVLRDIISRDNRDSSRAVAPLKPADDAVVIDTTGNTLDQSVAVITAVVKEKMEDAVL